MVRTFGAEGRNTVSNHPLMKKIAHLLLFALLPLLSGCISMSAIHATHCHNVETRFYESADKIEKAALTKDDQLCLFFEQTSTNTNSTPGRFTLMIPRSEIRMEAVAQPGYRTFGTLRERNPDHVYPMLLRDVDNPTFVKCMITSATLHLPGSTIQTNWALLENPKADLKFIPVGRPLHLRGQETAVQHGLSLILISNATETVYLTKSEPIEFAYIDTSIKRSMTIVTIDPKTVTTKRTEHPGYYFCLPLTVPADIATSPLQAACFGIVHWEASGLRYVN
jgi:hypothetical protein